MGHRKWRRRRSGGARAHGYSLGSVLVVALGGAFALNSCATPERPLSGPTVAAVPSEFDFAGRVTRIADGDTFRIDTRGESIRVWGLDAPETDQPGGSAATAELARLIGGQTLQCRQRDIDRYGRIVGQCFLPDGRDITAAMIASGTATEFCRYSGNHYGSC